MSRALRKNKAVSFVSGIFFYFVSCISNYSYSNQDSLLTSDQYNSSGSILNISTNPFTNDYRQSNLGIERQIKFYNLDLDFSIWKFSRKIHYGFYLNPFAYFFEDKEYFEDRLFYFKNHSTDNY